MRFDESVSVLFLLILHLWVLLLWLALFLVFFVVFWWFFIIFLLFVSIFIWLCFDLLLLLDFLELSLIVFLNLKLVIVWELLLLLALDLLLCIVLALFFLAFLLIIFELNLLAIFKINLFPVLVLKLQLLLSILVIFIPFLLLLFVFIFLIFFIDLLLVLIGSFFVDHVPPFFLLLLLLFQLSYSLEIFVSQNSIEFDRNISITFFQKLSSSQSLARSISSLLSLLIFHRSPEFFRQQMRIIAFHKVYDWFCSSWNIFILVIIICGQIQHDFLCDYRWKFLKNLSKSIKSNSHGHFRTPIINKMIDNMRNNSRNLILRYEFMNTLSKSYHDFRYIFLFWLHISDQRTIEW